MVGGVAVRATFVWGAAADAATVLVVDTKKAATVIAIRAKTKIKPTAKREAGSQAIRRLLSKVL
jgi:hypothetical protein